MVETSIAALVVAYGQGPLLEECISSLIRAGAREVVVVDNKATTPSRVATEIDGVSVLRVSSGLNLGFGRAINYAASLCSGGILVVSNPDVVVDSASLTILASALEDETVGIASPRMDNPDGSRYPSFRNYPSVLTSAVHGLLGPFFPNNPISRAYKIEDENPTSPISVPWSSGALMVMRREVFDRVGGFDPQYFLYCEDVDICRRVRKLELDIRYLPDAKIVHFQGSTTSSRRIWSLYHHHLSMWRYAKKTMEPGPLLLLSAGGIGVRFLVMVSLAVVQKSGTGDEVH